MDVSLKVISRTAAEQSSTAVAIPKDAGDISESHSTDMSAGHEMTGGTKSTTIIFWTQVLVLPQMSDAIQVRMIDWDSRQAPGAGASE
jgi:hypothetical protein